MIQVTRRHVFSKALLQKTLFVAGLVLFSYCYKGSTLDVNQDSGTPFNPKEEIVVEKFLPTEGRKGTRVVVYGRNFGNDVSKVKVTIGGYPAKVINVKGESLLCICPSKAYEGDVKVSVVGDDEAELKSGVCEAKFDYQYNYVVTTFLGKLYENNTKWDVLAGPFDDCGAFDNIWRMMFDPNSNYDDLYWVGQRDAFRHVDFVNQYVDIKTTNIGQCADVNFTLNGDMVVVDDQSSDTNTGIYLFTRASGFTERLSLCNARGAKTCAVHPQNGKIYYTRYHHAMISSYDPATGTLTEEEVMMDTKGSNFHIVWHPTGDWAYIIYNGKHCIYRVDYNRETGKLAVPYIVCGQHSSPGWVDGMGTGARLWGPNQGIFVKNEAYAGEEDEYDFYFCDRDSHTVRVLTPEGRVTTYAGRGNSREWGYVDGELRSQALFNHPTSIAYDMKRKCFYIGDCDNHRVRKIAPEE